MNTRLLTALIGITLCSSCQQTKGPAHPAPGPAAPLATGGVPMTEPPTVGPVDTHGVNPLNIPNKSDPNYVNPYPAGTYEHFVAQPSYPTTMEVYCDDKLLSQATVHSKIVVCLPQQRARMYVKGKVAYDWPVSTGCDGHETPTGAFRILDRETDHHSQRYGKFVKNGKVINSNVDTSKQTPPPGAEFQGSGMPHWNRLTWDGVGIHGGRVVAGKRLSHGCIRTPYDVARKLFNYTCQGMPVYVTRAVEDYNRGGAVKPIDVKYRPKAGNDYTDMAPEQYKGNQTNQPH